MSIQYDCGACPFNRLGQEIGGICERIRHCEVAKSLIKEEFGIEIPCGLAGAAIVDVMEASTKNEDGIYVTAERIVEEELPTRLGSVALRQSPEN
jgi:hypothetical protein